MEIIILSSFIFGFNKVNDSGDPRLLFFPPGSGPGTELPEPVALQEALQIQPPPSEPPAQLLPVPFPLLITDQGHNLILLADNVGVLGQHIHPLLPLILYSGGPPQTLIESLPSCGPDLVSISISITIVTAGVVAYGIIAVFFIVILLVFIEKRPSIPVLAPLGRSPVTRAVFFVAIGLHVVF